MAAHVRRVVVGVLPFTIALTDLSTETGGYLFLNVGAGADCFHDLHARLYSGPLAGHRSPTHDYRPHVTIGRLADDAGLRQARKEADLALGLPVLGTATGLGIFRLDGRERGAVVWTVPFAATDRGHEAHGAEPARDDRAVRDGRQPRRR
ncbi:2'-5' RNA ligase family protein [Candidatus Binatia bacterium]|nr:2'-5' RNA ligase family protein [Candidatus Binatia bacterium]